MIEARVERFDPTLSRWFCIDRQVTKIDSGRKYSKNSISKTNVIKIVFICKVQLCVSTPHHEL